MEEMLEIRNWLKMKEEKEEEEKEKEEAKTGRKEDRILWKENSRDCGDDGREVGLCGMN